MSHERQHEADTQLHGHWLLLARIVWFALVALTLSVYIANLPEYFTELQTVCRLSACSFGQLSPEAVVALEHFGLSVGSYTAFTVALATLLALVFFGTGGLIFWRKSDDWMALLFALGLVVSGTTPVLLRLGSSHSVWRLPILLVGNSFFLWIFLAFTLFPNGRFVPRWTRWLLVVFSMLIVILVAFEFFANSLTVPFIPFWIAVPVFLLFLSLYASLVIAQIYRYRYVSTLVQQQQTKWVVYGFTVNILVIGPVLLPMLIFPGSLYALVFPLVATCILFVYPLTMGIAILRYRLWDIDVLINRTLVYGTLTLSLALLYFGLIFVLQYLLRGMINQDNAVAIVVSTLAIATLFQPLRRRIQAIIDRRFYRSKYDAAKTLAAFNATLRNEVDLDQLRKDLVAVVEETMQPTFVSLWLRPAKPDRKWQTTWRSTPPASSEGK